MTFYKIIQNGTVTDVGYNFLEWDEEYHRKFFCDVNKAHFVISMDGTSAYRDTWMKTPPKEATGYKIAKVVIINEDEYNDLRTRLFAELPVSDKVEEDPVDIIPPVVEPEEDKTETVLTVSEMQKLLLAQQEKINELTKLLSSK